MNATAGAIGPAVFALTNTPGLPRSITATSGSGQSAQVNHVFASQFVAAVQDASGNAISGASVTFVATASVSGASGTFAGGAATAIVQTNPSGLATSPVFTANGTAGEYAVNATTSGLGPATFSLTNTSGNPGSITVTSGGGQAEQVNAPFGNPLVATVKDASGNPVPNANVTFTAPAVGASAKFTGGGNAITVQTNSFGVATSPTFTATTVAGNYAVSAVVSGATSAAMFAETNTAGPPASITVTSGASQSAQVKSSFGNPLVVTVKMSMAI